MAGTTALPASIQSGERRGYAPLHRERPRVLAAVVAFHVGIAVFLVMPRDGEVVTLRDGGQDSGSIKTFTITPIAQAPEALRAKGLQSGTRDQASTLSAPDGAATKGRPDAHDRIDRTGDMATLSRALSEALADDAGGGGDRLNYRARLMEHIRPFRAYPRDALRQGMSGRVVVRFRIGRAGEVVDLRILASHGAVLDEAAMSTIWRAEPLPPVPPMLSTPWEVDLPIDFFPPGRTRS